MSDLTQSAAAKHLYYRGQISNGQDPDFLLFQSFLNERAVIRKSEERHWRAKQGSDKKWYAWGWRITGHEKTLAEIRETSKRNRQARRRSDPEYDAYIKKVIRESSKRRYTKRTTEQIANRNKRDRQRYHTKDKHNPRWKAEHNLRVRLKKFIVGHKSLTMRTLLGCTKDGLVRHLESHFQRGMTWQNYGSKWHIDHIQPCASFDLTNVEDQKRCFHFSNLRPLWAVENLSKGARAITHQPELTLAHL